MSGSTKLYSIGIYCFGIQCCFSILAVYHVRRIPETLLNFSRQWFGGILDEDLSGLHDTFTPSITKVTRFIHINPESIHRYYLEESCNLQKEIDKITCLSSFSGMWFLPHSANTEQSLGLGSLGRLCSQATLYQRRHHC